MGQTNFQRCHFNTRSCECKGIAEPQDALAIYPRNLKVGRREIHDVGRLALHFGIVIVPVVPDAKRGLYGHSLMIVA